jgi:Flp pilus assembly protein TadD
MCIAGTGSSTRCIAAQSCAGRLAEADPRDAQAQRDLSVSYERLGDVALQAADLATAREFHEKRLEISRRLAEAAPRDAQAQRELAISYYRLGLIAKAGKAWDEAIKVFEAGRQVLVDFRERTSLDLFQSELTELERLIQECRAAQSK